MLVLYLQKINQVEEIEKKKIEPDASAVKKVKEVAVDVVNL